MRTKNILLSLAIIPITTSVLVAPFIISSCSKEYNLDVNQITDVSTSAEGYDFFYKNKNSEFRANPALDECPPHIQIADVYYTQKGANVQHASGGDIHKSYKLKN
jgi:hypothetical protein